MSIIHPPTLEHTPTSRSTLFCAICISMVVVFGCDEGLVPVPVNEPIVRTDRYKYFFSTDTKRDSILLEAYNGSDSVIYSWYPMEYIDLKQPDGSWKGIISRSTSPFWPVNPSTSVRFSTWIGNDDSNLVPGTYSFSGRAYFNDTCTQSLCLERIIRSNEFFLDWPDP